MKNIFIGVLITVLLSSFTLQNQAGEIVDMLKNGKASQVSTYFDSMIDLTLPGNNETKSMSKNQAMLAYKMFIDDNEIKAFDLTSERETGNTMYIAGKLKGKSKLFSLTMILKTKDNKHTVTSVRIN